MTIVACNLAADVSVLLLPRDTPASLNMSLKRKLNTEMGYLCRPF